MKDKELGKFLQKSLQQELQPERLEETITCCREIMRKQNALAKEPKMGFFQYLSEVFRFEGMHIFGLQSVTLFFACLTIFTVADGSKNIPVLMPWFVLAIMPVIFKSQFYGMSEIEAATRASGAQIILVKLILAGAANLVCMTVLLCLQVSQKNSFKEMGQMVLYCLVPYLVCMSAMLRFTRLGKKESIPVYAAAMLGSCAGWGLSVRVLPWLYETWAMGIWIIAFLVFTVFFVKEVYFIIEMRKEGKMYGIIA